MVATMKLVWCLGLSCFGSFAAATRFGKEDLDFGKTADDSNVSSGPSWERIVYVRDKMNIEREVVKQFTPHADELQELATGHPKVAFLFLTMKYFPFSSLWEAFFEDAPKGDYSIYIHRAAVPDENKMVHELALSKYGAVDVPWVKTAWCALFGVEVAMLFHAMKDPNNVQFVFVSDSSVPLKPFSYVYKELAQNSPDTSKICLATGAYFRNAFQEFAKQEARRGCVFRDFLQGVNPRTMKHHQWAVFNRRHSKMIVKYAQEALEVYEQSWVQAAPDLKHLAEGCSDEGVPLIAMLHALDVENKSTGNTWMDLSRLGVEQNCLTFIRWRNCFVGTELDLTSPVGDLGKLWQNLDEVMSLNKMDLTKSALKRELNGFPHAFQNISGSYLKTLMAQNFMFARKFYPEAMVTSEDAEDVAANTWGWWTGKTPNPKPITAEPLTEVLPQLWAQVDLAKAQRSQWSRLETSGKPGALNQPP